MSQSPTPREMAVERVFQVFRERGFEGASLADLSKGTGLGRSSLYHYFPGGKEEMAEAAVAFAVQWLSGPFDGLVRGSGPVAERIDRITTALDKLYDGGRQFCLLGQMSTACGQDELRAKVRAAFDLWIATLAKLGQEAGLSRAVAQERAEELISRMQGALLLCAATGDLSLFKRALGAFETRLTAP